jgi:hypothetical protein
MQLAISIALVSVGFGAVLSQFRALVLFPAIAVIGAFMLGAGIANSKSLILVAFALVISEVGLQLGYLLGQVTQGIYRSAVSRVRANAGITRRQQHTPITQPKRFTLGPF